MLDEKNAHIYQITITTAADYFDQGVIGNLQGALVVKTYMFVVMMTITMYEN